MYGSYSRYNNTLHCESDSCSVICYGNGCFRFEISCVTGACRTVPCDISADIASSNGYGGGAYSKLMDEIISNIDLLYNYDM